MSRNKKYICSVPSEDKMIDYVNVPASFLEYLVRELTSVRKHGLGPRTVVF